MNITTTFSPPGATSAPAPTPPAAAPAPTPAEAPEAPEFAGARLVTREQLDAAVERANEAMKRSDDSVRFAVHEGTNRVVVRIVDPASMEVIREFPDTHFLDMMAKLQELSGMQVDVQM